MKIKIDFLENEIYISQENIMTIEVENKKYFYRILKGLYEIYNNNYSEQIHFLYDNKEINNPNIVIFNDYFNIDLSTKKYTTEIQKYITNSLDKKSEYELMNNYKKLHNSIYKILKQSDLPLIITQDYNIELIIKLMKISIQEKEELLDTLFLVIDLEKILKINRIIILVNLKQYLSKEELNELYKYSIYNNINIILIDNQTYGVCTKYEKKLIIDNNLDEIML